VICATTIRQQPGNALWIADGTVQRYRMKGMKRKRYIIPMGEVERLRRAYEEIVEGNNYGLAVPA